LAQELPQSVPVAPVQTGTQLPRWQSGALAGQTLPQAPQLFGSLRSWTHWPLQKLDPNGQAHAPDWQNWPAPQLRPQVPQFAGSLEVSVHAPAQTESPAAQAHWLFWHCSLGPQASPQAPQFAASLEVSTQAPPQSRWPVGQPPASGTWQAPLRQVPPLKQMFPQVPQLRGSFEVSTQLPAQSRWPGRQPPASRPWQAPFTHATPFAQVRPQAPQLLGSLARLAQPLGQATWPGAQKPPPSDATEQIPSTQRELAPQDRPQPPQFALSLLGSTQASTPLGLGQAMSGAMQPPPSTRERQMPPAQVAPRPQALPHWPQLSTSFRGSMQLAKPLPSRQTIFGLWQLPPSICA